MTEKNGRQLNGEAQRRFGVMITLAGLFVFIFGARPHLFGLDASHAVGFMQVTVFSFGLLVICLGGTISLGSLWPANSKTIAADIGARLAWTGMVIAVTSAMADIFGLGTRPYPEYVTFFGHWQARGAVLGEVIMIVGFLLMIPYHRPLPPEEEIFEEKIEITEDY